MEGYMISYFWSYDVSMYGRKLNCHFCKYTLCKIQRDSLILKDNTVVYPPHIITCGGCNRVYDIHPALTLTPQLQVEELTIMSTPSEKGTMFWCQCGSPILQMNQTVTLVTPGKVGTSHYAVECLSCKKLYHFQIV